jgi:hypothetical protein
VEVHRTASIDGEAYRLDQWSQVGEDAFALWRFVCPKVRGRLPLSQNPLNPLTKNVVPRSTL